MSDFLYLPVSKQERDQWYAKLPYVKQSGDSIDLEISPKKSIGSIVDGALKGAACFASIAEDYQNYEVVFTSSGTRKHQNLEEATTFMQDMMEAGVAPPGCAVWEEEGELKARVPKGDCYIRAYCGLSVLRWALCIPELSWAYCQAKNRQPGVDPMQALLYAIGRYAVYNLNHSFIGYWSGGDDGHRGFCEPVLGLALRLLIKKEHPLITPLVKGILVGKKVTVNTTVWDFARELNSGKQNPVAGGGWDNKKVISKYQLLFPEDILHPTLKPLFTTNFSRVEELGEFLAACFTRTEAPKQTERRSKKLAEKDQEETNDE